jgi:hypothetical protein
VTRWKHSSTGRVEIDGRNGVAHWQEHHGS